MTTRCCDEFAADLGQTASSERALDAALHFAPRFSVRPVMRAVGAELWGHNSCFGRDSPRPLGWCGWPRQPKLIAIIPHNRNGRLEPNPHRAHQHRRTPTAICFTTSSAVSGAAARSPDAVAPASSASRPVRTPPVASSSQEPCPNSAVRESGARLKASYLSTTSGISSSRGSTPN
jgi:hypothetical protein